MELSGRVSYSFLLVHIGCLILLLSFYEIEAVKSPSVVDKKIYERLNGTFACFRRYNGTHQTGCASNSLNGDTGILHLVNDEESLNWVAKNGPHAPYIAVMYPKYFTPRYLFEFQYNKRVAGILLLQGSPNTTTKLDHFSTDSQCPNRGYGLDILEPLKNTCEKWNYEGTNLLQHNWDFPIFFVNSTINSDFILKCYNDFNKPINGTPADHPLCAAQLQSFMLGAVDTPTCIRRSNMWTANPGSITVCDKLGDENVHAPLIIKTQTTPYKENSVIIIGARMDASSMFDNLSPGADSAATGITTLLTIVKQMSEVKDQLLNSEAVENIYFILFNGEAFDYIGSSRIVYDMSRMSFPYNINESLSYNNSAVLKIENIKYFIEVGQVGSNLQTDSYYIHENPKSDSSGKLTNSLKEEGLKFKLSLKKATPSAGYSGLPPASFQRFLLEDPKIPGVIITNHEKAFKNKFYNSIYDDSDNLEYVYKSDDSIVQKQIANLAATISNTVWSIAGLNASHRFEPDVKTVDELLYCYTKSANCQLFQNVTTPMGNLPNVPYPFYVGVKSDHRYTVNTLTLLTRNVMIYYQGTNVSKNEDECSQNYSTPYVNYMWINGSCFETTVNTSDAVSPAFLIDDYDWKSGQYSTWTESIWQKLTVRVFVKPSLLHELLTLCFGIALFVFSLILVRWVNSNSDILFDPSSSGDAILC